MVTLIGLVKIILHLFMFDKDLFVIVGDQKTRKELIFPSKYQSIKRSHDRYNFPKNIILII